MSAKVTDDIQAYYKDLIDNQWDSIEPAPINWSALRSWILKTIPFYAAALQLVDIVVINDKKELPSFAFTDGYKVYVSPKLYTIHGMVVEKSGKPWFKTPELGMTFSLLHEIGHIIFDTFGRAGHRNLQLWNVATDYQINQFVSRIMKESNVFRNDENYTQFMEVIRKNFVMDPAKYANVSAEGTYDDLYKTGASGEDYSGWSMNGDCVGNGTDNIDGDGKPLSPEEQMARDIIRSEMKDYASKNSDLMPGKGSSYGREFEFAMEPPKISLRDVLKHITDRDNSEDFGWNTRGSRMDHMMTGGIRLPVIVDSHPDKVKKVMMVLDCSGSMTSDQLNDALNIIRELLHKHTKNPVHLIIHTSEVVFSGPIENYQEVPKNITGGTAFMPVLEHIARLQKEERIIPSAVIWMTDLYGELSQDQYNARNFPWYKKLRWIISGSDLEAPIGKNYHIDTIN